MSKYTIPHMLKKAQGTIVNNASIPSLKAIPGAVAYNSTKGAVVQLTRSMALEYADKGIRMNCICPGTIFTPMVQEFLRSAPEVDEILKTNSLLRYTLTGTESPKKLHTPYFSFAIERMSNS